MNIEELLKHLAERKVVSVTENKQELIDALSSINLSLDSDVPRIEVAL